MGHFQETGGKIRRQEKYGKVGTSESLINQSSIRERSGSVVECLTRDRRA